MSYLPNRQLRNIARTEVVALDSYLPNRQLRKFKYLVFRMEVLLPAE